MAVESSRRMTKCGWQIYVPKTYDASKPAGARGLYQPVRAMGRQQARPTTPYSTSYNVIWAGILGRGRQAAPLNERIMKAIMTPTMLAHGSIPSIPTRVFIGGFSGGAHALP